MAVVDQSTKVAPIKLSQEAITQILRIRKEQNVPSEYGLRVGIKGGGCSGFSYILGFDQKNEKDQEFEIEGVTCFMEQAHGIYLLGMEIDWHDGLDNRGFVFINPNAKESCGCGSSFSA